MRQRKTLVRNTILSIASIIYFIPIYIAFVNAFKREEDILRNPIGIPFGRKNRIHVGGYVPTVPSAHTRFLTANISFSRPWTAWHNVATPDPAIQDGRSVSRPQVLSKRIW